MFNAILQNNFSFITMLSYKRQGITTGDVLPNS